MGLYKGPGKSSGSGLPSPIQWPDPEFSVLFPALYGWMSDLVDEEGQSREGGTLLIFVEAGWIKACLHDRDTGFVAFCSAGSFQELLGAADGGLASGRLDWRAKRADAGQNRGKK
jgi:hypothetical protein